MEKGAFWRSSQVWSGSIINPWVTEAEETCLFNKEWLLLGMILSPFATWLWARCEGAHASSVSPHCPLYSVIKQGEYNDKAGSRFQTNDISLHVNLASYSSHKAKHKTSHTTNKTEQGNWKLMNQTRSEFWEIRPQTGAGQLLARAAYYVQVVEDLCYVQRSIG